MLFWLFEITSIAAVVLFAVFSGAFGGWYDLWKLVLVMLGSYVAMHAVYLCVMYIVTLFMHNKESIDKQSGFCRLSCVAIAEMMCMYAGLKVHIKGEEKIPNDGRFLFVCNHRSMFDPLIVMDRLRKYNISFISKQANIDIPIAGELACGAGFLPIDRENNREALKTINKAAGYLKSDLCSIGIYPEGTRSKSGKLLPFHSGSFKIAQKAGVPVVVASVSGTEHATKNMFRRRTDVTLNILEVISAEDAKTTPTAEMAERAKGLIEASLATA